MNSTVGEWMEAKECAEARSGELTSVRPAEYLLLEANYQRGR